MKKLVSLLLLGVSGLSVAGHYDFSRLDNMSVYEVFVQNKLGTLMVSEVEKQNGKMNEKYRNELIKGLNDAYENNQNFNEVITFCMDNKEKCALTKVKEFFSFEAFKKYFLQLEEVARNEGQKLFIQEPIRSFNAYQNMTLSQLGQLPKREKEEFYDYIKKEYGMIYFSQIGRAVESVGYLCQEEKLLALFGHKKMAEARKEYKCDVKLKSLLK